MKLYDKMGTTIKKMIQAVDPISFACYYSGFEYSQILWEYVLTIIDVNKLTYNIFHNAGQIYDSTTNLIDNFRFNTPYEHSYWKRIGNNIGLIINQISYKPSNYDPYNNKNPKKWFTLILNINKLLTDMISISLENSILSSYTYFTII